MNGFGSLFKQFLMCCFRSKYQNYRTFGAALQISIQHSLVKMSPHVLPWVKLPCLAAASKTFVMFNVIADKNLILSFAKRAVSSSAGICLEQNASYEELGRRACQLAEIKGCATPTILGNFFFIYTLAHTPSKHSFPTDKCNQGLYALRRQQDGIVSLERSEENCN